MLHRRSRLLRNPEGEGRFGGRCELPSKHELALARAMGRCREGPFGRLDTSGDKDDVMGLDVQTEYVLSKA